MQTFCEDLQETVFSSEDAQQLSQRNTVRSLCVPRPPSPVLPPPVPPMLSASSTSLKVSSSASVHILISAPFFSSVYFTYSFASHFLLPLLPRPLPSPPLHLPHPLFLPPLITFLLPYLRLCSTHSLSHFCWRVFVVSNTLFLLFRRVWQLMTVCRSAVLHVR